VGTISGAVSNIGGSIGKITGKTGLIDKINAAGDIASAVS
jgi:hypothetical protein